uniref:Uncharacterized protein n=1 Tax=Eptatretus burgeri TaxID=7764 RepID=A0A8C4QTM6_EPTBU
MSRQRVESSINAQKWIFHGVREIIDEDQKRIGPRTPLWATPALTARGDERIPLRATRSVLLFFLAFLVQKLDRSKLQRIKETDDTWKFVFFRKSSSGGSSMTFESAAFPGWYISSRESGTSVLLSINALHAT